MALDTRYGEARHAGQSFPVFSSAAPQGLLQQASMAHDTRSFNGVPRPMPDGLPTTRPRGGEQGGATLLEAGPPREQSCVEAVMDYLEGPLVGNFEFMFVDEEGAPEVAGPPNHLDDKVDSDQ